MKKSFLVIGAGRFGTNVARTISDLGHDVMVIDNDDIIVAVGDNKGLKKLEWI